jgi:hypothetical protein
MLCHGDGPVSVIGNVAMAVGACRKAQGVSRVSLGLVWFGDKLGQMDLVQEDLVESNGDGVGVLFLAAAGVGCAGHGARLIAVGLVCLRLRRAADEARLPGLGSGAC